MPPSSLADVFYLLVAIYEPNTGGRLLVEWFKDDWAMFNDKLNLAECKDLLADILEDGDIVRHPFAPSAKYRSDGLDRWEKLRAELMHENRYFPAGELPEDRLRELFDHLLADDDYPRKWFRVRLQLTDDLFPITEMGPPPPRTASHGRANPAGIPYLYLASSPQTALAETRPHTGEKGCVADFTLPDDLRLLDLQDPRALVSPFVLGDEDEIGLLRSDIDFLERLGQELTRPILPQGAPIDYVPSQYLCEFIKTCGYAGVLYRSSVSSGINLALFNPQLATGGTVEPYVIKMVTVEVAEVVAAAV